MSDDDGTKWLLGAAVVGFAAMVIFIGAMRVLNPPTDIKHLCRQLQEEGLVAETMWSETFGCLRRNGPNERWRR